MNQIIKFSIDLKTLELNLDNFLSKNSLNFQ
jgi:hypothetical protein